MPDDQFESRTETQIESTIDDGDLTARVDAANRLERHLDEQLTSIQRIDDKAEHITRLLGVLLGLVFTALSVLSRFSTSESAGTSNSAPLLDTVAVQTEVAFLSGVVLLLASLFTSVITYLSSVVRRGLHPNVGHLLSRTDYETNADEHVRRVLGTYGYNLRENHEVVMTNARRLRLTLLFLLLGVLYLSISGVMFLEILPFGNRTILLTSTTVSAVGLAAYVLSGRFLTLNPLSSDNE